VKKSSNDAPEEMDLGMLSMTTSDGPITPSPQSPGERERRRPEPMQLESSSHQTSTLNTSLTPTPTSGSSVHASPKSPRMGLRRSSTLTELDRSSPLSPMRLKRRSRQPSYAPSAQELAALAQGSGQSQGNGQVQGELSAQPTTFEMEADKISSLRNWIMGFAVGQY
jgi:hypothetical protein